MGPARQLEQQGGHAGHAIFCGLKGDGPSSQPSSGGRDGWRAAAPSHGSPGTTGPCQQQGCQEGLRAIYSHLIWVTLASFPVLPIKQACSHPRASAFTSRSSSRGWFFSGILSLASLNVQPTSPRRPSLPRPLEASQHFSLSETMLLMCAHVQVFMCVCMWGVCV